MNHTNNTIVELGLTDRHYFGGAQFDGSLAYRQGIGGLDAQDDMLAAGGGPIYRERSDDASTGHAQSDQPR